MSPKKNAFIQKELLARRELNQFRKLKSVVPHDGAKVVIENREMVNFCSNDYLGLSRHPLLKERAVQYIEKYGNGSTASRLVCGNIDCFESVEKKLAMLKGSDSSLLLNSGYQANVSFLPALADRKSLIIADKLSHNSLIQGSLLARCKLIRFQHNDMSHLEEILKINRKKDYNRIFIVTESVFSMDGDCCDLDSLEDLAEKYSAFLVVDEAHATGLFGDNGMGMACNRKVDLVMGTFGKACGSFGAYLATQEEVCEYLVNYCSGLIYSTALPPSVVGAIDAALELIPTMDAERKHLSNISALLRNALRELGFDTGASSSQIIPIIIGSDQDSLALSDWLYKHGILAWAIRPPTVEKGKARIRLALSALHNNEQIDMLIDVLRKWRKKN